MESEITDSDTPVPPLTKKKNLNAIYIMHSINGLAGSLVGIFIPIYFLGLGYSLFQIFVYWLVYGVGVLLSFIVTGYFAAKFGLRKSILAGFPFLFLFMILLYGLKSHPIPIYLVGIVSAISVGFYWFPLHVFFASNSTEGKMGKNVGKLFAFPQLIGILGPLVGGVIAGLGGFRLLILTSIVVYLLSAVPLFWIPELEIPVTLNLSKLQELFKHYSSYFSIEFVENIREEMEGIIWPIFIFLTFRNIFSIGILGALLSLGSFVFMLFIGKYTDKMDKKIFMKAGSLIMIAIWILRYFVSGPIPYYSLTILAGFFGALIVIPFSAFYYNLAKKDNVAEFIIFREIPVTLGRIVLYSLALIIVSNIKITFLFTAFASIFYLFF
jgi:MFS family permease